MQIDSSGEKIEKLLNDIPYVPWMDLAIVVFVLLEVSPYGTATVLVRKEHLEIWGTDRSTTFAMRRKKITPILLPYQFCPMRKLLREICPYAVDEGEEEEESLYVLSNKLRSFGAASMLYEGDPLRRWGRSWERIIIFFRAASMR